MSSSKQERRQRGPGRPRQAEGEDGRARILGAGLQVFAERGYEGASVADVAAAAGVVGSVIYHHFGSKAGLWTAIVDDRSQALIEHVAAALPPPDTTGRRLPAGVEAYFSFIEDNRAAWRLLVREPPADPALLKRYRRLQRQRTQAIGAMYEPSAKPRASKRDKERFAGLLATAIRSFASWWYENPDVPRKVVVEAVVDFSDAAASRLLR